jgi:hypothetical protein
MLLRNIAISGFTHGSRAEPSECFGLWRTARQTYGDDGRSVTWVRSMIKFGRSAWGTPQNHGTPSGQRAELRCAGQNNDFMFNHTVRIAD